MKLKFLLFILLVTTSLVNAQSEIGYDCGSFGMMGYGGGFMLIFSLVFWILVIVALALLIIWLTKQIQSQKSKK